MVGFLLSSVACGGSNAPANTTTAAPATTAAATTTAAAETTTTKAAETTTEAQPEVDPNVPIYLRDTSPITFDWYVDESWYTRVKWGQDKMSQYVTNKTGVALNIIIPQGDQTAKKTVMIASGDLPDFIGMGQWHTEWRTMRDAGMLWSFQELAEIYDQSLFDVMKPSILNYWRHDDGKNYVYTNSAWPLEDLPNAKYMMNWAVLSARKDMYEGLGRPDMSQPEGFLAALRAAKEKYPTVDGKPLIPFLLSREFNSEGNPALDGMLESRCNIPGNREEEYYTYDKNIHEEKIRWLRTYNQAYREGLITPDQMTWNEAMFDNELMSGRAFLNSQAANVACEYSGPLYQKDPNSIYVPIDAVHNSKGEEPILQGGGLNGWHVTMITKKCKDPVRAAQFLHYYLSEEGQSDFYFGDETMHTIKNGRKWLNDDLVVLRTADEVEFCSVYGGLEAYFMLAQPNFYDEWSQDITPLQKEYYDYFQGKLEYSLSMEASQNCEPETNTPAAIALTEVKMKWGEILPRLITAKDDAEFDSLLAQYKTLSDKNFPIYGPVQRELYEKNLAKLKAMLG